MKKHKNLVIRAVVSFIFYILMVLLPEIVLAQHNFKLDRVTDINPNSGSGIGGPMLINGMMFFTAWDGVHGRELWVSDGTEAGTYMVKDINPQGNGVEGIITRAGNKVFFISDDSIHGRELWVSDGTALGTHMAKDINTGANPYTVIEDMSLININNSYSYNDALYFMANDGVHGWEWWKSDGTELGTMMLKDINPEGFNINHLSGMQPSAITYKNLLYFTANDSVHGFQLWKTDGTENGTENVLILNSPNPPPYNGGFPHNFYTYQGNLYFAAVDSHGIEPWISDGTAQGTRMLRDINLATGYYDSSYPRNMHGYKGRVYFTANDEINDDEMWVTDGTEHGTIMFINPDPNPNYMFAPYTGMTYKDKMFFTGYQHAYGYELWVTDGTRAGTEMVIDFDTNFWSSLFGTQSSGLSPMFEYEGYLFLGGDDGNGMGAQMYVMDETMESIMLVQNEHMMESAISRISPPVFLNGYCYFAAEYDSSGLELWRMYDSTLVGIRSVNEIDVAAPYPYPNPVRSGETVEIVYKSKQQEQTQVNLYTIGGKHIREVFNGMLQKGDNSISLQTSTLKEGVYIVRIKTGASSYAQKLVVVK